MGIPDNIDRAAVLKAMEEIDKFGVPKKHVSTKYSVQYKGKLYPPKYVLSLANKYVNHEELDTNDFYGGKPSNRFLENLGFIIVNRPTE